MPSYSDSPITVPKLQRQRLLVLTLAVCALAVLFLFVLGNVRGMTAHRVDDYMMDQQSHGTEFRILGSGMSLPVRYFDLARSRLFLNKAYGRILDAAGGNFDRAYLFMLGVYFVTGLLMLRFAERICGLAGGIGLAAFYLTYWQKNEPLLDYSGTLYIVVIGIFIGCLMLENSRLGIIRRYVIITLLLWFAIHLYEILIFAPFVLAGIMAGRLWLDEHRWPTRREVVAVALPFIMTGLHVLMLACRPGWYTRNPNQWVEQTKMQLLQKGFANAMDVQFGWEAARQWRSYWDAFWTATFPAHPVSILAIPIFLILTLIAVRLTLAPSADPAAPVPAQAPPARGHLWGLIVTGAALVIFAPLLHISLGVAHGCPGRFLYLPSVGYCMITAASLALIRSRDIRMAILCVVFSLASLQALQMKSFFHMNVEVTEWDDRANAVVKDMGWKDLNGSKIFSLFSMRATTPHSDLWRRSWSLYEQGSASFYFWQMQKLKPNAVDYEPVKAETLSLEQVARLATSVDEWRREHPTGPVGLLYFDDEGRVWGLSEIRWLAADGRVERTLPGDALGQAVSPRVRILELRPGAAKLFRLLDPATGEP